MGWAERRRFIILLIIGGVAVAFLAVVLVATLYKAPSCADGVQNQGEQGIDCGGPCAFLCRTEAEPPTVLYTQALGALGSRTDIIAAVENKNAAAAAKAVPYRVSLYGVDQSLIGTANGVIDLPPASIVPVFVPGVASGAAPAARAFLTIDPNAPAWYQVRGKQTAPTIVSTAITGASSAPRVRAVLGNPSTMALMNVHAVVLVRGKDGNIIAASSTIVPSVPGQGTAVATFTWNHPFSEVPLSVEVVPVLDLP